MRIIGGAFRRRRLRAPAGSGTRPTADRVKEALFSILGDDVVGQKVLDLFAGSGALGLEALSRGAEQCLFVEKAKPALMAIKTNIIELGLEDRTAILAVDAMDRAELLAEKGPFGLIFADPPYEKGFAAKVTALTARAALLTTEGWLVLEHSPREETPEAPGLALLDRRTYGQTQLSFFGTASRS